MPITRYREGMMCKTPIIIWLIVAAGIYLASLIRNIIVIIAIHNNDGRSPKDIKQRIEFLYICLVMNFEVAWLIYGNTFHYSRDGIACMNLTPSTHQLWILMMLILGIGYVVMLLYGIVILAIIIGGTLIMCCYRDQVSEIN